MIPFSIFWWKPDSKHDLQFIPYNVKACFHKNDTGIFGNVILF